VSAFHIIALTYR